MIAEPDALHADSEELAHARALYWRALVQLKVDCEYTQRYRDRIATILTWFAIGRAVVSVGALGSWFAGVGHAKLWGAVIVVSQIAEAVLAVLPLTARARALRSLVVTLDAALVDALFEWEEDIQSQAVGAADIRRRWHRLMRLRHEAETAALGSVNLPRKPRLFALAEAAATSYFHSAILAPRGRAHDAEPLPPGGE
jgi:hypothetical protein